MMDTALGYYDASRSYYRPPSIRHVAMMHGVSKSSFHRRVKERCNLPMFMKLDMYDVVQKYTDDDHDIIGVAVRYFNKTRDQYKPPSMRCVAKIYGISKSTLSRRIIETAYSDSSGRSYVSERMPNHFQTVSDYSEMLTSNDEVELSTTLETMFGKLNTLENRITVTQSARMILVRYFSDICEMELFATGKVVRPNLGNLSISARMVSEPGIHHHHMSTIRSGEMIR